MRRLNFGLIRVLSKVEVRLLLRRLPVEVLPQLRLAAEGQRQLLRVVEVLLNRRNPAEVRRELLVLTERIGIECFIICKITVQRRTRAVTNSFMRLEMPTVLIREFYFLQVRQGTSIRIQRMERILTTLLFPRTVIRLSFRITRIV